MSQAIVLASYSDRFTKENKYDKVLVRTGKAGQASEHNEMQSIINHKLKETFDVFLTNGEIIEDCEAIKVDDTILCQAGKIYCDGCVREVDEKTFNNIDTSVIIYAGISLKQEIITELEDPSLYSQEVGIPSQGQAGAARLKVWIEWELQENLENLEDFFPIYSINEDTIELLEVNKENLSTLEKKVNTNSNNIEELQSAFITNANNLITLQNAILVNANAINSLQSNVSTNATNITALQDSVNEKLALTGGTISGSLTVSTNVVVNSALSAKTFTLNGWAISIE